MFTTLGFVAAGLIGFGYHAHRRTLFLAIKVTAARYGVPAEPANVQVPPNRPYPCLYLKGVRDPAWNTAHSSNIF